MKPFKNVFVILTLLFTALFIASCDESVGDNKDSGTSGDSIVCTYYMKDDTSVYYVFYGDKTAEYHANGKIANTRSELIYSGDPLKAGTVSLKISLTGTELISFNVKESNGTLIPTVELVPGFPVEYTLTLDGENDNEENSGTDNESSPLMFMGFDNVVTIKNGTDITGITNTIYSLTSDTTLKFKGGINSITLTTIAAAMGTNDSVKIALDFSEATGITEWTNKLAGVKTLYAISLPGTVTSVQDEAFKECTNLKAITVPKAITEFPSNLPNDIIINLTDDFWEWMKNPSIIPDGQTLYLNGEKLSNSAGSIIIPEGITTILDSAFEGCEWLITMTIPEGVKEIGNYAFKNCTNLTTITIPKSIQSFGEMAFRNCENLDKVYYKGTLETWLEVSTQDYVFYRFIELPGYDEDPWGGYWTWKDVDFYINGEIVTDVVIPNSVTSIRKFAFCDLRRNLKSVTIPNSVTIIEHHAFSVCSSLTSITIPNSVTIIGNDAFDRCSSLTSITIPNSVKSIEWGTFNQCSSLTSIIIPDSVTSLGGFERCSSLTNVVIPNSVTHIKSVAFEGCDSLTSITIPDSVIWIGEGAFSFCDKLSTINYRGSEEQWNAIQFFNGYEHSIPSNITIVYNYTGD